VRADLSHHVSQRAYVSVVEEVEKELAQDLDVAR
jgi:hypothetical protein